MHPHLDLSLAPIEAALVACWRGRLSRSGPQRLKLVMAEPRLTPAAKSGLRCSWSNVGSGNDYGVPRTERRPVPQEERLAGHRPPRRRVLEEQGRCPRVALVQDLDESPTVTDPSLSTRHRSAS